MSMKAIVKSVLSGDTLVLRGRPGPNDAPPKERVLHLAGLAAPRMGSATRDDEPFAFESREFLRSLTVGKEVTFAIAYTISTTIPAREFGLVQIGGMGEELGSRVVREGWAKVRETGRREEEGETPEGKRRELLKTFEEQARSAGKGLWTPEGPVARSVTFTMPLDSQAFLSEFKGRALDAIVEQVRDGSTLRVRLLLSPSDHQWINLALAGVRAPKTAREGSEEPGEEHADAARFFTESRLLQRPIKVTLLSLPSALGASPFPVNGDKGPAQPQTASIFIGLAIHPAGNIAEFLVSNGFARVIDWHAGMLAPYPSAMERLRTAERTAKSQRLAIWKSYEPPRATGSSTTSSSGPTSGAAVGRQYEALVSRVWGGDQLSIVPLLAGGKEGRERRIQLASVRAPRTTDPKQAFYAAEAKEFARKKLIGKKVTITVDYIRPAEDGYDEREAATVRFGGSQANIGELLVERGLATVIRHRRDDESRSGEFDALMAAEQRAAAEAKGVHSGKEVPLPRIGDASETGTKAAQFLPSLKRTGRVPAVVDFVAAGSRFKLFIPREGQRCTFVLSGIRAPRTARNPSEKSEPYGQEALDYTTRRLLQRDVEVLFDGVDRAGGFIGTLFVNGSENFAVSLVREGLGTVHAYSAEGLSFGKQLFDAEEAAKREEKNIWKDYDAEAEAAQAAAAETDANGSAGALASELVDLIVSDVRTTPNFAFSVQVLNSDGIQQLEKLMNDFSIHHRTASSAPGFTPRAGELVSAIFSQDGAWYRARVRRASPIKKEAEVTFIDYGNQETVPFSKIRPLDSKFKALPAQAQDATLSFVNLLPPDSEYGPEAIDRFRQLCEGRKLIGRIDQREGNQLHLRLIDPADPRSAISPEHCINVDLVADGLATIDRKSRYAAAYPKMGQALQTALDVAKSTRAGAYEYGDVSED